VRELQDEIQDINKQIEEESKKLDEKDPPLKQNQPKSSLKSELEKLAIEMGLQNPESEIIAQGECLSTTSFWGVPDQDDWPGVTNQVVMDPGYWTLGLNSGIPTLVVPAFEIIA